MRENEKKYFYAGHKEYCRKKVHPSARFGEDVKMYKQQGDEHVVKDHSQREDTCISTPLDLFIFVMRSFHSLNLLIVCIYAP